MTQTNNEREALIADAKEAGFINHPIHGLVVRHSNGSWISIAEKLEKFATLQLARAISQNEQTKQIPDGWKPIETAPKDGTRLLLDIDHGDYGDRVWTGLWADGWVVSYGNPKNEPTHWMPLPSPPTSETNTEVGE